jgi:hypothetical protein
MWFMNQRRHEEPVRHQVDVTIHATGGTVDLSELKTLLLNLLTKVNEMSVEMDTLVTEVAETRTVIDSAVVFIQGIKQQLDEAGTDKTKLAELSAALDEKQQELATAIANPPTP